MSTNTIEIAELVDKSITSSNSVMDVAGSRVPDTNTPIISSHPAIEQPCSADRQFGHPSRHRANSDRGEGVISAAIAVLIVAFLGAAMWVAFNAIWGDTHTKIKTEVQKIGGTSGSG